MVTTTQIKSAKRPGKPKAGELGDFALRVRRARKDLVLTIQAFSAVSGIPTSTIKNYEHGHSKPTAENLQKMYAAGVNPMWILLGHTPVIVAKPKLSPEQRAKAIRIKNRASAIASALKASQGPESAPEKLLAAG